MDTLLKFCEDAKEEAINFAKACLENNEDFRKLDYELQCKVLVFVAACLSTFRLVQLSNKLRGTDFFKA